MHKTYLTHPAHRELTNHTLTHATQALVFHNVVPVISYRLKGDAPKIRTAILAGSGIPLLLFLVWNGARLCVFRDADRLIPLLLFLLWNAERASERWCILNCVHVHMCCAGAGLTSSLLALVD